MLDAVVYGYIYWLTRLKNERCTAGNETLAELASTTPLTIGQCLVHLDKAGFIQRIFKDNNPHSDRIEIIPLLVVTHRAMSPHSREPLVYTQQNKSIKEEQILSEPKGSREVKLSEDGEEVIPREKKYPNARSVYRLWGTYPANWRINTAQLRAAENLYKERGLERIRKALAFIENHKGEEFIPEILTPYDLDSKWIKLIAFKKRV